MSLPVPDKRHALGAVKDATGRYTALLRRTTAPEATAVGHWTVRDVAVHTSHIYGLFPELMKGGHSPVANYLTMSEHWDAKVTEDTETDLGKVADRIEASVAEFVELAAADDWTTTKHWHGGLEVPVYTLASILVTEPGLHGLDIARTAGESWKLPASHGQLAIEGLLPVLPHFVNREATAALNAVYRLDVRGGNTIYIRVAEGALGISTEQPGSVDCRISADPVAYVLVGYGRMSQWEAIAKGKIFAFGRKPWLAWKFGSLFYSV